MSLTPLFPGTNDIDQIYRVFQVMGTPTAQSWPGAHALPDFDKISFPEMAPLELSTVLPMCHSDDLAFLRGMLQLDPAARLTATSLLQHQYFSQAPLPAKTTELTVPRRGAGASAGARRPRVMKPEEVISMVSGVL
jgi:serine/threonine protein kinase